uniref:Uncharacterized protein n=1 Tax=Nelumbo nucifera TaxID=4432 RepID=A0A822YQ74_NELNU|nr:TPA_asm: hypothetical protein HUJ06_012350 [Nelumbo nucifera]
MAKKKASKQEKPPIDLPPSQEEKKPQEKPRDTMEEDPLEKLASLKSLNALLLKETVERRQQVDSLLQSKEALESEISRSAAQKQTLTAENELFEDEMIAAEIEQRLTLVFVSSQLHQQAERLKSQIRRENEKVRAESAAFKAKIEENVRDEERRREAVEMKLTQQQRDIDQLSDNFSRYKERASKDIDLKQKEMDQLRSIVENLEKSNEEARNEIRRIQVERDGVLGEKEEMVGTLGELKKAVADVVRERDQIEQARIDGDREIDSLKKSVEAFTADLSRERDASDRVLLEKDMIQKDLDIQTLQVEGLRSELLQLEKNYVETQNELRQLQTERQGLLEEKEERERDLGCLLSDKDSLQRRLEESSRLVEDTEREIRGLVAEKEQIELERTNQAATITELQKEVGELISTISILRKHEESLQLEVSEMGKRNADALEKQEHLREEFNALVEEKREAETSIEQLMEEKSSTMRSLEESLQQLEEQRRKMFEIVKEKADIEQVKIKQEIEIAELHKEAGELRATTSELQRSCDDHTEKNNQLQHEVISQRDALEHITVERDDAMKELEQERNVASSLRIEIVGLEKNLKDTQGELMQISMERDSLIVEKKEKENHIELLMEDKAFMERTVAEAQQGLKESRMKVKSADGFCGRTLSMLKDTATMIYGSQGKEIDGKEYFIGNSESIEEEILPFVTELEAIKKAFRNREEKAEDMNRQLELLHNSLTAQKKRNFWAWLSSATAIFAAVSVAFASSGR